MTQAAITMTITFWNKSLDARRDPIRALQADVLKTVDDNLHHLVTRNEQVGSSNLPGGSA